MERARRAIFGGRTSSEEYEPLTGADEADPAPEGVALETPDDVPFSWIEYCIFGFLGAAMLWAWNMFLASAPYFSSRLATRPPLQTTFQPAILAVSTLTNLSVLLLLSNMQHTASYPFRINLALAVQTAVFALLAASTMFFLDVAAPLYFAFLLAMVALASWATGLIQNGAFAFAASYGRGEYMQALMAGQAVAGVLPAAAQVSTVLLFPPRGGQDDDEGEEPGSATQGELSAFFFFSAAIAISLTTLLAFIPLLVRHNRRLENRMAERMAASMAGIEEAGRAARKVTSLWLLFRKLRWLALGLALTFAVTMFFPVFTAKIHSVRERDGGAVVRPTAFIPLGFLFWNLGDLGGRIATMLPFSLQDRPSALFLLAVGRLVFLPLYLLCNIRGRGAVVPSDVFYLVVVQLGFGLTNGWLGSSFMMASGRWVDEGEREATGGFMGLFLVIGLAVGSLLSFTAAGI